MIIKEITTILEKLAPLAWQEDYDNAGLCLGKPDAEFKSCLVCIDVTEKVIDEAIHHGCNLIISHHPVIFKGLKRLNGNSMTERVIEKAIRADIALYAMHTNLDNVFEGVNRKIASKLGLIDLSILRKSQKMLRKLVTFCPTDHAGTVREAIFRAGAGHIGEYDQCSFNVDGTGTFRAGESANPFTGSIGELHFEKEVRIETIFPAFMERGIIKAMIEAHPYEEVAYDIYPLENEHDRSGAGMIGSLEKPVSETEFLNKLKDTFAVKVIRHSALKGKKVEKVAICGGSGSFMIPDAIKQGADFFVSGDIKYHQFFDADDRIVIADIGHYESEQFTSEIIADYLKKNFVNFAVRISDTPVNPVNYF